MFQIFEFDLSIKFDLFKYNGCLMNEYDQKVLYIWLFKLFLVMLIGSWEGCIWCIRIEYDIDLSI